MHFHIGDQEWSNALSHCRDQEWSNALSHRRDQDESNALLEFYSNILKTY